MRVGVFSLFTALLLVSGCSTVATFPDCYGGTRGLFRDPFPITEAQFNLGSTTGTRHAGPMGLIAINALWLLDLPLSFAFDTVLAPFTVWTLPHELSVADRKERAAAKREQQRTQRDERLAAWKAEPSLAVRALGDTSVSYFSERGVHDTVGGDAVAFLLERPDAAERMLHGIEAHLEAYLVAADPQAERSRVRNALEVLGFLGERAAPASATLHVLLQKELELGDRVHGVHLEICSTLGSLGVAALPAVPDLARVLDQHELVPIGAPAHARSAIERTIRALKAQGSDAGITGLRTLLEAPGLTPELRKQATWELEALLKQ